MDDILELVAEVFGRYLATCLLVVILLAIVVVGVPLGGLAYAFSWHASDPQGWEDFWSSYLLSGAGSSGYTLTGPDAEKVRDLGYDVHMVAACIEAINWVSDDQKKDIDIGMCVSIWQNEGIGQEDGLANACKYSPQQCTDAKWLLERWSQFKTRDLDQRVSDLVTPGYDNYKGAGAGEIGPGIMPSTAKQTGTRHFNDHPITLVQAFDALSDIGGSFMAVSYLADCGYDKSLSPSEKLDVMSCWNRQEWWDQRLLDTAAKVNADLEGLLLETMPTGGLKFGGWLRNLILQILQALDLVPEDISDIGGFGGDHLPNPFGTDKNRRISSYYSDNHPGLDFPCTLGEPVLSVADGKIIIPNRPGWRYDPNGWGYQVWIDHGGGRFTHYAHLMEMSAETGYVKAGDQIGKCGSTGNSTGPHVHFEVTKKHPDRYTVWNDPEARMRPYGFLGIPDPDNRRR